MTCTEPGNTLAVYNKCNGFTIQYFYKCDEDYQTHMRARAHTHTHTHTDIYMCVCVCVYIYIYIYKALNLIFLFTLPKMYCPTCDKFLRGSYHSISYQNFSNCFKYHSKVFSRIKNTVF